jgi:putative SOS response-associated peptidase YedK
MHVHDVLPFSSEKSQAKACRGNPAHILIQAVPSATLLPCAIASARSRNGPTSPAVFTAGHASISSLIRTAPPTELVPILVAGQGVVLARFGINRLGSGDKLRPPLLNVRTDGMRKGQFRKHLKERRCVIPCEGFYEWRDEGGKQPYYFSRKDGKPLMLAGIWEIAEYKGDSRVAFAILTDEPNELVASYHDRMPLSLADDKVAVWLDLANESPLGGDLLLDLKEFTVRPMDRAMNNVRQKNLAAIDPEADAA